MRRVHETIVAVEKQKVAVVNQHAKYFRLIMPSVASLVLHISPRHRTNGTIFGRRKKKLLNIKYFFNYLYSFCPKNFSF